MERECYLPPYLANIRLPIRPIALALCFILYGGGAAHADDSVQFNTDVLDVKDRSNLDLSKFEQAGYVMPGEYPMSLIVNRRVTPESKVSIYAPDWDPSGSLACITPDMLKLLGLKESSKSKLSWWHNNECLDPKSLPGTKITSDLGASAVRINIPQAYLEYAADDWDPPSLWDDGVAGILLDYSINAQASRSSSGKDRRSVSGNGVAGVNIGPWRFRADWQAQEDNTSQDNGRSASKQRPWSWSRFYAYRALPSLGAKLTLGENYLSSGMFDSFRYTGASLESDDSMLPPALRGYAPEVRGVAKTNAKVTITQQGRVIYETNVAAGPFRIQDLNEATNGTLDVTVTEEDGSTQFFQVEAASIPYLTRPGMVRYKFSAGKPSDFKHSMLDAPFGTGEFSWGVSNGWSIFGGGIFAGDYNSVALGIGRDLLMLGAMSLDVTQSRAAIPGEETKTGLSYRLSYSKRFDDTGSQITFAGYRFSQRDFMNMSQYLDERFHHDVATGRSKELYTISFNQQLDALNMSMYLNYNHQTYWDKPATDSFNISASRFFDIGSIKDVSLNISAYSSMYNETKDNGVYVSLSVPWGESGSISYDGQSGAGGFSNNVGYRDNIDANNSYQISAGIDDKGQASGRGYLSHSGEAADMSISASIDNEYKSLGMSLSGGITVTPYGAALHHGGGMGGTRMMVDTNGVSDVPIGSRGVRTNMFGKAVDTGVSSYYRNSLGIDLNHLSDEVDAPISVVEGTLTEGAIGYRKFSVISGKKKMAVIRRADGSFPPFGASVWNRNEQQAGLVGEDGYVWLSGLNPDETMSVKWDGEIQCRVSIPKSLGDTGNLLLPCK